MSFSGSVRYFRTSMLGMCMMEVSPSTSSYSTRVLAQNSHRSVNVMLFITITDPRSR
nr:TPA_asm: m73.6 sORF 3 [Murid betaherpesvirus 1]DBA07828.1 TPA_asm: m73.6 sORF 3 [Murid betaherpesvirus 1]